MKKTTAILIGALCAATGIADSGTLTLEQALKLARENSPGLRAARLNTQATEKSVGAAGLWINPNVEVEVEGVGGDLDLFSESEYTVGLKQEFQRGGKRSKARAVALKSKDAASLVALEQELELDVRVRTAFIELAGQQETGKVRAEQEQLGRAFVEVAKQRHRAGGGSELDVVQAELALEEIILSQTCCFGDLEAAKVKMASLIGIPAQELVEVTAAYYELATLKDLAIGSDYPSLQRLEAEAE
ncbi:MAG: TolC family protein, partial [Kiritimatiellales bacterium]|nr:TolC family protein [Kiritimatiellales bacterium]